MTTSEDVTLENNYRRALTSYVGREVEEAQLMSALELGRTALQEGYGLLNLLVLHQRSISQLIEQSLVADTLLYLAKASEFLTQAVAPFEMAYRGWHDLANRLRRANEELEKRVAERTAAHREAVERLDRAQQIASIGSWELDLNTGQQIWSRQMYCICGLAENAQGSSSNIVAFVHHDDRERHDGWLSELKAGRYPAPVELRADGDAIRDANGAVSHLSCAVQDITERKTAETQLHELQAELAHIARLNTIGHMASAIAHELNQPLSAIANYLKGSQRLLNDQSDERSSTLRDALNRASEQTVRAGQIVRRLRDFMSRREIELRVESIHKLVEETSSLALVGAKDGGIKVTFNLHPEADLVLIDKIQVQQVLLNLMRNAIEAMQASEQRKLSISSAPSEGDMILVSVVDSGPGIAEEVAAKLFQPFVTSKQQGMGVGLSISRTIIESQGGKIWFEPNPEGGTIFRFTLHTIIASEIEEAG
jgi:C4-dicarboxylate-specific signal transduction histidine kinase